MNDLNPTPAWTDLTAGQKGDAIRPLITKQLLSYSQIARIFGTTRNAVAAAADRHRIISPLTHGATGERGSRGGAASKARTPKNPKVKPIKPERPRFSRVAPTQPLALPDDLVDRSPLRKGAWLPLPGTAPKPLDQLEPHDCKWPLGDGPFTFCGQPAVDGKPYCEQHNATAYKPRSEIRKGTAA